MPGGVTGCAHGPAYAAAMDTEPTPPAVDATDTQAPVPPAPALAALLPPDVDLGNGVGLRHPAARSVWYGVVWGRLGRGDLAALHLDAISEPQLQPWIAAERGRLRRELGDHAGAAGLEAPALRMATDPVDRVMLLVSLAADAVGLGDVEVAARRLDDAQRHLATATPPGPRAQRQRLRASWVAVEVAWASGRTPDERPLPRLAADGALRLDGAYEAGSGFHLAKGLLFAGVVRQQPALLDRALAHAPPALWWAVQLARGAAGIPGAEEAGWRARTSIVPLPA